MQSQTARAAEVAAAAAAKATKGRATSTARAGNAAAGISLVNESLRKLNHHLLCSKTTCNSPGVAGQSKFCHVSPVSGKHISVKPSVRDGWAQLMVSPAGRCYHMLTPS